MKISTDHLPFSVSSETSMNLPLWNAWVLKGWTWVLIRDMKLSRGAVEGIGRTI
jgi:hypothetical protein